MATITISNITATSADWTISGLSYDFKSDKYLNAGITTEFFTDGTTYLDETQILSIVTATSYLQFDNYTVSGTITGLAPGTTYTVYAFAKTLDLKFWRAGSWTFTTPEESQEIPCVEIEINQAPNMSLKATMGLDLLSNIRLYGTYYEIHMKNRSYGGWELYYSSYWGEETYEYISFEVSEYGTYDVRITLENPDGATNTYYEVCTFYDEDFTITEFEVERGYRSLTFKWYGATDATYFRYTVMRGDISYESGYIYSWEKSISGLNIEYPYSIKLRGYNEHNYAEKTFISEGYYAAPYLPGLVSTTQTNGLISVSCSVDMLDLSDADNVDVVFQLYNSVEGILETNTVNRIDDEYGKAETTFKTQCSNGMYYIRIYVVANGVQSIGKNGDTYVEKSIEVVLDISRPENWYWDRQNGDEATLAQTLTAHDALTNADKTKRYTTNFHYKVWNDFVDKVKEFLVYKKVDSITVSIYGRDNITQGELLETAKMDNENRKMTPNRFNIVRFMIGSMAVGGSGISDDFVEGQEMKGSYILTLAEAIKNIE